MLQTYEEHLRTREARVYKSTRLWTPRPNVIGMSGEAALAEYFGYPNEMVDKPGGDNGIDRQLLLRTPRGEEWIDVDVKASSYGDILRVDASKKIKPEAIYVLGHYRRATGLTELVGWEWGSAIVEAPTTDWCNNGTIVHYVRADELRDLVEILDMFTGKSRDAFLGVVHTSWSF